MPTIARLATAVLVGVALLTPVTSTTAAPASALKISVTDALAGEKVTLSGYLPQSRSRAYVVQRKTDQGWVRVIAGRTDRAGRHRTTITVRKTMTLRVVAPRQGGLAARSSVARTVRMLVDRSSVALVDLGRSNTARATLTVLRPGRPMVVEKRNAQGAWAVIGRTTHPRSGTTVTMRLTPLSPGPVTLRLRMGAWRGAQAYTSAVTTTRVAAPAAVLPQIDVTTDGAAPVATREDWVRGSVSIDGVTHPMRIRGRGNSTWNQEKKPYRFRLDSAASVLGLPADRDWVLLANYFDRSHLRNAAAFEIAARTGLAWTPSTRHVNLTLNGKPLGLYVLTEHVRVTPSRVQLAEGGVFAEVDERLEANAEPGFRTPHGTALVLKEPEDVSDPRGVAFKAWVEIFEDSLYGRSGDPDAWRTMIDQESFADWYLVNELFKNVDADFFSSVFMTWDPAGGGLLTLGPVWDFDLSAGLRRSSVPSLLEPQGWYLRGGVSGDTTHPRRDDHWLATMLKDETFAAAVARRWRELSPAVATVVAGLDARADAIAPRAEADLGMWPGTATSPVSHATTFRGEVDHLRTWLTARRAWLDARMAR